MQRRNKSQVELPHLERSDYRRMRQESRLLHVDVCMNFLIKSSRPVTIIELPPIIHRHLLLQQASRGRLLVAASPNSNHTTIPSLTEPIPDVTGL